jgi:hypothetical protein
MLFLSKKAVKSLSSPFFVLSFELLCFAFVLFCAIIASAATVAMRFAWEPSQLDVEGYRLYCRQEGDIHGYSQVWQGGGTSCVYEFYPVANTTYCFVMRAYDAAGNESSSSNEVCWRAPANIISHLMPVITSPYYGQIECELLTHITTEPFSYADSGLHGQSRWQISEQEDFPSLILDVTSSEQLRELTVPHMLLEGDTTYYVRVEFYDAYSEPSGWSETIEFTTASVVNDLDANGVPDEQEVGHDVDLNGDGIADNDQPDVIKCAQTTDGAAIIGVCKVSDSISAIDAVETIDPATISDNTNRPGNLSFGLFSYRIRMKEPGAIATVRIYFSKDISKDGTFFKYDTISGWHNYSDYATINEDGRSITVEVKDGGYGDSDREANGVIVDPGGPATASSNSSEVETSGDGGGCSIATAAYGSSMARDVLLLKDFRNNILLKNPVGRSFVRFYYEVSPPFADYIEGNESLKTAIRIGLMPLVAISYSMLHFGPAITLTMLVVLLVTPILLVWLYRSRVSSYTRNN